MQQSTSALYQSTVSRFLTKYLEPSLDRKQAFLSYPLEEPPEQIEKLAQNIHWNTSLL
jgi:hypothetical protein